MDESKGKKGDEAIDADGYDPENPRHISGQHVSTKKHVLKSSEEEIRYEYLPKVDDFDNFNTYLSPNAIIRLDEDIFEWLSSYGLDYQSRANSILRRQMLLEKGFIPPQN